VDPKDQELSNRGASVMQRIPANLRGFVQQDVMKDPAAAARKYGISEGDAYMLAGYFRKFGG
jgi:hypothetical protein